MNNKKSGHVAWLGEIRYAYSILFGNLKERNLWETGLCEVGLGWLSIGFNGEDGGESSGSVKENFLLS
jgi:hypothetical protein